MRRSHVLQVMIAGCLTLAMPGLAAGAEQSSAELVASGRAFALKVCWACHVVAKDQTETPILSHPAPSFLTIAQRPDLTEEALRKFLASHNETMGPAGRMPNPRLVGYQIDEVVAYIMSLRK
ncbi:MAG: c-type cytochrome [Methylovirgula sp.]